MTNSPALSYEAGRSELLECLEVAREIQQVDLSACDRLQAKLKQESFNLVAVGQFKRGKSSLINALLGLQLLPVGVIPLTSVITVIRYGAAPALSIVFESGEVRPASLDELQTFVTEAGNPNNAKRVREAQIDYPSSWLQYGLRLIDTPGIGSLYEHNNDMTMHYVPEADAILFVGSVDQPMSRAELELLSAIRPYATKLFCLMNKTDYLSAAELAESLRFSAHAIETALGTPVPVYAVSARHALEEKLASGNADLTTAGLGAFEAALRQFVTQEKTAAWFQSISRGLRRILSHARLLNELELQSLATPVEKVKENVEFFSQKQREMTQRRLDYEVLLKADLQRLIVDQVQGSLNRFKDGARERVLTLTAEWVTELREVSSRQLTTALEQRLFSAIASIYDGWINVEEPKLAKAFKALCERFSLSIQGIIDELSTCSAALFDLPFEAAAGQSTWIRKSELTYRFWREPVGLQILTSSFVSALPRFLGRPLIVARMRKLALDLVEVQAGRIRHELEQRLVKSCQEFRTQLVQQMEAMSGGVERAIEQGLAIRHSGEMEAWRRRAELGRELKELAALESRADAILGDR